MMMWCMMRSENLLNLLRERSLVLEMRRWIAQSSATMHGCWVTSRMAVNWPTIYLLYLLSSLDLCGYVKRIAALVTVKAMAHLP